MSGNESPGGDDSLSLSSSSSTKVVPSIHHLDPKYKNYVSAVDKALKSFEYSSEWHDLISALTKLNKVIITWSVKYGGDLPRLHLVTKRLSQCLHPALPGGVHLKTLETYELIFKSIPADRTNSVIGNDLFCFASGLFPLWTYSSEQTRPTLLRIYETYLLPLITQPALEGFLISILSGLAEDENTAATTPTIVADDPMSTIGRVNNLLENVTANVGTHTFNKVLWRVIKSNAKIRLAGINYIIRKTAITEDESLAVETLISCLVTTETTNESVLVQRATLDLFLNHFRLESLNETKKTKLIKASLQTLLRRDMSLNRRLFSWLLGTEQNYFETHCKPAIVVSCIELLNDNNLSSSEIVRILISLLDKPEINILDDILLHIVIFFKRVDSRQCANLFFVNLQPEYVFDQILLAIKSDVKHCSLLEYLIDLDLTCFEYPKLLPKVFRGLLGVANPTNICDIQSVFKLILKKIELDADLFSSFVEFYLRFVEYGASFNFDQYVKPKLKGETFEKDEENHILKIFPITQHNLHKVVNIEIANDLFEELLDPLFLKEMTNMTDWLKALIVIGCHGDVETISLLVTVVKLLDKSLCFEIVDQTFFIELSTWFLWEKEQFETLSELVCLNTLKVEKILLSFLKDFESFRKLIEFLEFVGDFGDVKLLVYKLVENLDCTFEQSPAEFLELKEQAEEFCCKMLRDNDLRFIDVFISSLLIDFETVGEHLNRAKRAEALANACLNVGYNGGDADAEKLSIDVGSVSDVTSEYSYHSLDEEDKNEVVKANSSPDLTNLNLNGHLDGKVLSRSMGDLNTIRGGSEIDIHVPEIMVEDQDGLKAFINRSDQSDFKTPDAVDCEGSVPETPRILTPSTELAIEARAKSTPRGFSKKLSHSHLKVSKELTADTQNRILYVLAKLEKFLLLKPDFFISYLKSCNTNQSPRIKCREECIYLELLMGKLLDFMCVVIPSEEIHDNKLQLRNLNIQFKSCNVLNILLEKVVECERLEMVGNSNTGNNINNTSSTPNVIGSVKGIGSTPTSSTGSALTRRHHFSKLRRKFSNSTHSHFVADLLTRVKVQKTLLFVLRSTTIDTKVEEGDESGSSVCNHNHHGDFDRGSGGTDLSLELLKLNYGPKYLIMYQGLLLRLTRTVIGLESLISSINHTNHSSSKSQTSLHRNHPNHKYLAFLPLTNQPLFHEILLTALELREDSNNSNHFTWADLNMHILPYIINSNCPVTILVVSQICKNLQIIGSNSEQKPSNQVYIARSLDYLISITNAVLFRHGDIEKPEQSTQIQSSSSIYGIITSFLPGSSSSASPKIESVDEIDCHSKDILYKLDVLVKTCLSVKSPETINKLKNLLNPICNSYLENFLTSISILPPSPELTELCKDIETIRLEKLTIICSRILNRNLILFYRNYLDHVDVIGFNSSLLNSLLKECLSKNIGLVTICEIVDNVYLKFKPEAWSKQELKELQENIFKVFDRLVAEVCNQNSQALLESSNSSDSNGNSSGQHFLSGQQSSKSYNLKKLTASEENMEDILSSLSVSLPSLVDLLWTDDKERDKVMPILTHLLGNLIALIKLKHTSTSAYLSILKLLRNMSYYSYFRKAWKKEAFELLLLEPGFFQMIKPHYYYTPVQNGSEASNVNKILENQRVVQIWKVIMDNLFTQDKSSFSELLTRVSVPQTSGLNIFSSKDTEFEGRAVLLKRLSFVIWSSEQVITDQNIYDIFYTSINLQDQFAKFITNIQERIAEALRTPNSPQIVPVVLRSVFLCFRVLVLRFSNLSALWPIIIHEVVQVLLNLEKQLTNGTKLDHDQLACVLEVFKLIELLSNLPTGILPLFQMYRWAFVATNSLSREENLRENNNINHGFTPFLLRIAAHVDDSLSSTNSSEKRFKSPIRMRTLISLSEVHEYLSGHCDNIALEEINLELDLDFIEC